MKRIKLLLSMLCLMALFLLPLVSVKASEASSEYEVYIDDQADLLTDEEEKQLQETMSELLDYGNMMFTTVTLTGNDYVANSQNAYYDKFGNEPGVNFQIDMGNRKLTLSASTDMEDMIGSERDSIVDNIYTYATDGDYLTCAEECFNEIYKVTHDQRIAHKMKYINNAIIAVILGLILNFLFVFFTFRPRINKRYLTGLIVSSMAVNNININKGALSKKYDPPSSSSSGGSGGGSSGGGGGGGFSGGSSSHGF